MANIIDGIAGSTVARMVHGMVFGVVSGDTSGISTRYPSSLVSALMVSLLQGHSAEVLCLSFDSSGGQLVTGSFDHTLAVWDVASGRSDSRRRPRR